MREDSPCRSPPSSPSRWRHSPSPSPEQARSLSPPLIQFLRLATTTTTLPKPHRTRDSIASTSSFASLPPPYSAGLQTAFDLSGTIKIENDSKGKRRSVEMLEGGRAFSEELEEVDRAGEDDEVALEEEETDGERRGPTTEPPTVDHLDSDDFVPDPGSLDPLDLLILQTSSILSTSRSILNSTSSARTQLRNFFALEDTLSASLFFDRETQLRRTLEDAESHEVALASLGRDVEDYAEGRPVWKEGRMAHRRAETVSDPRSLLRGGGGGALASTARVTGLGHPPRTQTLYETADEVTLSTSSSMNFLSSAAGEMADSPTTNGGPRGGTHRRRVSDAVGALSGLMIASSGSSTPLSAAALTTSSTPQSATTLLRGLSSSSSLSLSSTPTSSPSIRRTPSTTSFAPAAPSLLHRTSSSLLSSHTATSPALSYSHSSTALSRSFSAISEDTTLTTPSTASSSSRCPSESADDILATPTPRTPTRIRHTRASPSLSVSTTPLPTFTLAPSLPSTSSPSSSSRRISISRPSPSPSPGLASADQAKEDRTTAMSYQREPHRRTESGLKERLAGLSAANGGGVEEGKEGTTGWSWWR